MSAGRFHSRWKSYFQILLVIFGLSLVAFIYLKVSMFLMNQNITDKRVTVEEQTKELDNYKSLE